MLIPPLIMKFGHCSQLRFVSFRFLLPFIGSEKARGLLYLRAVAYTYSVDGRVLLKRRVVMVESRADDTQKQKGEFLVRNGNEKVIVRKVQ
jgi:hypothetical protein